MTKEPIDKFYGVTMSKWIAHVPDELSSDAVGLWQIVPAGMLRFGLSGDELVEYVRRNIYALLDAGAVPVVSGSGTDYEWLRRADFGTTKEQIADSVIIEWQHIGNDPAKLASTIWFARPLPGKMYVKVD
jgi:hypothetical protein